MAIDLSAAGNTINDALIVALATHVNTGIDAATAIGITDNTVFRDISSVSRAHTLADGVDDGDHVIAFKTADTGVGTITPASFREGTSVPLTVAGDLVSFTWKTDQWELRTAINVITNATIAVTV